MTSINEMFAKAAEADGEVAVGLIVVKAQTRSEFEDAEHPLSELAETIRKVGILQPLLVRPLPGGKFELIAGERRLRAAKIVGLKTVPVLTKNLTDEEADLAQQIENIYRKNLTQLELARKLKSDCDKYGRDAVLTRYGKQKGWLTQHLNLLDLTPQAARMVKEHLTGDITAVNNVLQIEKHDPVAAKKLVDSIADSMKPGAPKVDVRKASDEVKKAVKPPPAGGAKEGKAGKAPTGAGGGTSTATSKNIDIQQPSAPGVFSPPPLKPHERTMVALVEKLSAPGGKSEEALAALTDNEKSQVEKHLQPLFASGAGAAALDLGLLRGVLNGTFGKGKTELFGIAAYLQGANKDESFSLAKAAETLRQAAGK